MATIVSFHAHPDDESIGTGGTLRRAADEGHRVVLVFATRGERGEPTPGVLRDGEALWERRMAETFESARLLGAQRVEFLGYVDSGMMGEPTNEAPYSFWTADVEHAANRLAAATVLIDIPEPNAAATRWAEKQGLVRQRVLTRMRLGQPVNDRVEMLWASSGPEKG